MRNPFIAGSWVRGENFFGRQSLLREILEGDRDAVWVVGARRLGKTSLMKELEYRVHQSSQSPWAPLYWDLEGSADARGLADSLLGSIEDSEAYRRAAGIVVEDVEGLSVTEMLTALVRRTVRRTRLVSMSATGMPSMSSTEMSVARRNDSLSSTLPSRLSARPRVSALPWRSQ